MFISRYRPVRSKTYSFLARNRTTGIYMHLPKYWNCRKTDFNSGWVKVAAPYSPNPLRPRWEDRPEWWDKHVQEWRDAHAACRWPHRHRSYVGYLRYVGNRMSWTWFYMGNPFRPGSIWEVDRYEDRREDLTFLNRKERKVRQAEDEVNRKEANELFEKLRAR